MLRVFREKGCYRLFMAHPSDVPRWLLNHLFLKDGIFNDDRTAVISGYDTHAGADPGSEAHRTFTTDLATRHDWKAIQNRLADEQFACPL
jgi:hypothetical protein